MPSIDELFQELEQKKNKSSMPTTPIGAGQRDDEIEKLFKTTQGKKAAKKMQSEVQQVTTQDVKNPFAGAKAGGAVGKAKTPTFAEDPAGYITPPSADYTRENIAEPSVKALKSTFTGEIDGKEIDPSQRFWNLFQGTVGTAISPALGLTETAFKPLGELVGKGAEKISELGQKYGSGVEQRTKEIFGEENVTNFQETVGEDVARNLYEPAAKMKEMYDNMPEEGKLAMRTAFGVLELLGLKQGVKETGNVLGKVEQAARLGGGKVKQIGTPILEDIKNIINKPIQKFKAGREAKETATRLAEIESQKQSILKNIESNVDEILKSNQTLSREAARLGTQGTDVKKHLSNPEIYRGLKVENGKIVVDEALDNAEGLIQRAEDAASEMIPFADENLPKVSKAKLREEIMKNVGDVTPKDKADIKKRIDNQLEALPDELSYSEIDKLRAQSRLSSRTAKDELKSGSEYAAMESGSRNVVFDSFNNLPIDTGRAFTGVRKYIKELIQTKKFIDRLRTKSVKAGKMEQLINKTTGAIAGSSMGPFGALAGSEVAGFLTDIISSKRLGNDLKESFIRKFMSGGPEEIQKAEEVIQKMREFKQPLLTEGTGFQTELGTGPTINLPEKSITTRDTDEVRRLGTKEQGTSNMDVRRSFELDKLRQKKQSETAGRLSQLKSEVADKERAIREKLLEDGYKVGDGFIINPKEGTKKLTNLGVDKVREFK